MFWYVIGSCVVCGIGLLACLRPELVWRVTEQWKSYSADEPSDFYLRTTRIGGALMALVGLVLAVLSCFL